MRAGWTSLRKHLVFTLPVVMMVLTACSGMASALDTLNDVGSPGPSANATPTQPEATESPAQTTQQQLDAETVMAAYEQTLNQVYQEVLPSVVHIRTAEAVNTPPPQFGFPFDPNPRSPDGQEFFRRGEGSGFVWDNQGHIVTNHHVVADADRVTVTFPDGATAEANVLGTDPDADLAVLKVDLPQDQLQPVELADSDAVKVGQLSIAIGNPFGQEFTMTSGIVSAVGRTIQSGASEFSVPHVIQTDAAINPGNSGGPLLDRQGRVIGINTQIITRSGASAGVGFAVPISVAKQVVPSLISNGAYEYSWLGIRGATLPPDAAEYMGLSRDTRGALVIEVTPNSPASEAGIQGSDGTTQTNIGQIPVGGDVIVSIDGQPVEGMDDLIAYLVSNTSPGDIVTMEVIRDGGQRQQIEVTLGTRPRP